MHDYCCRVLLGIVVLCAAAAPAGAQSRKSDEVIHYQKPTPEQAAAAIADAQKFGKEVGDKLAVKFTELQTDHFIVFTDWDPREYGFLKRNVEAAYTAVSRQFEMSPKDNIFIGKLPVFMFAKQAKFKEFSKQFTKMDVPNDVAGYYVGNDQGYGFMTMWKPDVSGSGGNVSQAEKRWAHTLTHEFTHAFVARYRSNRHIPRWLNEGIAEVVAYGEFPNPNAFAFAKRYAATNRSVSGIFNDKEMPGGEMYPVMMTLVQALARENPRQFLKYFNAIKDGADPETTLKEMYKVDYAGLEKAWRTYMRTATK